MVPGGPVADVMASRPEIVDGDDRNRGLCGFAKHDLEGGSRSAKQVLRAGGPIAT
jgi:hypothetical protein